MATTVSPNALIAAESLLVQVMRDQYPNEDWSPNSALRDLVVRTLAYGLAYLDTTKTFTLERSNAASLALLEDTTAVAAADALLSNFFITRNTGDASSGVITVYLSKKVDVLVKASHRFYKTASQPFHITTQIDTVIPSSQLHTVVDGDGNITEYWFNLPVTADDATAPSSVPAGTWVSWSPFNAYVTRIENLSDFANGTGVETNAEFIGRAHNALTVRNLISNRSIDTVLRDEFSTVTRTLSVGAGDPEQQRDRVVVDSWGIDVHVLGHIDTYLWLPLVEDQVYSEVAPVSQELDIASVGLPIYRLKRAYYDDGFGNEIDLTYTNELTAAAGEYRLAYDTAPSVTFSAQATPKVLVGADVVGQTIFVVYDTVSGLSDVDTFVTDRNNRVLCSNHLVKTAVPVYVDANILYTVRDDATEVLDESAVAAGVASYINALEGDLYVSNVIAYILDNWGHIIENVRTPLYINYVLWSTEGLRVAYSTDNKAEMREDLLADVIADPYPSPEEYSMSSRLMRFVASASGITVSQDV